MMNDRDRKEELEAMSEDRKAKYENWRTKYAPCVYDSPGKIGCLDGFLNGCENCSYTH